MRAGSDRKIGLPTLCVAVRNRLHGGLSRTNVITVLRAAVPSGKRSDTPFALIKL